MRKIGFTVGELIEHLQKFDKDLPVATECFDNTYETTLSEDNVKEGFIWTDGHGLVAADDESNAYYTKEYGKAQKAVLIYT